MELFVTGISHRTAPIGVRELLAFRGEEMETALRDLKLVFGIEQAVLLCTCNRTEVYGLVEKASKAAVCVADWLGQRAGRDIRGYLYSKTGAEAFTHLFRVASSLDSLVLGEPQILGQVKAAFSRSRQHGFAGPGIERVFSQAFRVAKRVRSETHIGKNAVSVAFVGVELAKRVFEDLNGRSVMLVGAGKMCELAARHLLDSGVVRFVVANRSEGRARDLAAQLSGEALSLDHVPRLLEDVDIVISSTDAPGFLITREQVLAAEKRRRGRPLFLIDLSVPRDVDPAVRKISNVHAYDVDDLDRVAGENRRNRAAEADRAALILDEEVEGLLSCEHSRGVAPVITSLRRHAARIAEAEVDRTWSRLASMGVMPEAREGLEAMARAIVNKLLHEPTRVIRESAVTDGEDLSRTARALFGLEGTKEARDALPHSSSSSVVAVNGEPPSRKQEMPSSRVVSESDTGFAHEPREDARHEGAKAGVEPGDEGSGVADMDGRGSAW